MKLNKYFLLSAIMGLATFTGCSDDDGICEPLKLTFSVKNLGSASASVDTKGVGLWISSTSVSSLKDADVAKNQKFIPNAQELTAEGVNWTGQEKLYTYGYYPYDAAAASNPEAYAVTATNNPDLMWAKTETNFNGQNATPKLAFSHLMSKVVLNVKSDAKEAGALAGGAVTLNNFKTQATANLLNGQMTATGEATDVTTASTTTASGYEGTYEAIVVPQTLDAGVEFLTMVTTGNVTVKASLDASLALNAGEEVTLEVVLKEEECVVTVKEIKAWTEMDAESIVAERLLPSFNVYDLYDVDGVKGIVISLDEGSDGKHGWIVSLDETFCKWWTGTGAPIVYPTDKDNAVNNLDAVKAIDPTLDAFPAMKWCEAKNVNGVAGWVLPAFNTLKLFGSVALKTESARETFNQAVKNAGGTGLDLNDDYDLYYFSSTCSTTRNVRTVYYSWYYDKMGWPEYAYDESGSTTQGQMVEGNVRAFYHF